MVRARSLRALVVGAIGVAVTLSGCGGDDTGATAGRRADLRDALGFLATDFDLSTEEVDCVERTVVDRVDGADLDAFAEGLRRVETGSARVTDLPSEDEALLTSAIADCVAGT